jgi:hypothetical protein
MNYINKLNAALHLFGMQGMLFFGNSFTTGDDLADARSE